MIAACASPTLSDSEIVERVRRGEREYYEILIRRYNQRLYRLVYPILSDSAEAEDVIQETYLRAFTHIDQFAGKSSFATWLGRIAIYEALGRLRRRRPVEPPGTNLRAEWKADPEQQAIDSQLAAVLNTCVHKLPQAYRSVVVARLIQDMSTLETCQRLRLSEEAVKTRLHRAKAMLRRELHGKL